jgi:hypothetical protein
MKQILTPRRTGDQRKRNHKFSTQKKIKKYIKDGGKADLNFRNSPCRKTTGHLKVGGSLNLGNTPIKEIPGNLKIGGSLYLSNTPIKELPDNLKVSGLFLQNTPLSKKYTKTKIRNLIEEKGGYVDIITTFTY